MSNFPTISIEIRFLLYLKVTFCISLIQTCNNLEEAMLHAHSSNLASENLIRYATARRANFAILSLLNINLKTTYSETFLPEGNLKKFSNCFYVGMIKGRLVALLAAHRIS